MVQEKYQGEKACDKRQRNGNSAEFIFINVTSQQPDGQLQKQHNIEAQTTKTTKQDTYETNNNNNNNNNNNEHWYEHVPKSIETSQGGKVTISWNQEIQTDGTIPNNKPDILIRDNEKGTCMLIDVAISGDRIVIKKEAEKILKYKDLTIEAECMWNVKTKVISEIIGATGTISKSFRKYVSNIPGKHEVKELQKTAILDTAHIFRKS